MTSGEELQRLLYATLTANANVMALAHRVYDRVSDNPYGDKNSYIAFGPVDSVEDDAECIDGVAITQQIDVWSKGGGALECRTLTDLVRRALHRQSLSPSEHAIVDTWVELTRVFPDPSGDHHGVVQVRCLVEEAA